MGLFLGLMVGLLREHGERPCCRAAEQSDELTPSYDTLPWAGSRTLPHGCARCCASCGEIADISQPPLGANKRHWKMKEAAN